MDPQELNVCIFCLTCRGNIRDPKAKTCSYGLGHEFLEDSLAKRVQQVKKPDAKLCSLCGLHPKNPLYSSYGCDHTT